MGAEASGRVHRSGQTAVARRTGLHEQNMAVRTHGADHIQIQRLFLVPSSVSVRIISAAALVDLAEATICSCTGRKSELRTIDRQVLLRTWVSICIDDRDRCRPGADRGYLISIAQRRRAIAVWRGQQIG